MKAQQVEDYYIVHECTRVSNQASSDSDRCEPSCYNFNCKGVSGWVESKLVQARHNYVVVVVGQRHQHRQAARRRSDVAAQIWRFLRS